MSKAEQIAQLALIRAATRCTKVIIPSDNLRETIAILRGLNPHAVLSLVPEGIRVHGMCWGNYRVSKAA